MSGLKPYEAQLPGNGHPRLGAPFPWESHWGPGDHLPLLSLKSLNWWQRSFLPKPKKKKKKKEAGVAWQWELHLRVMKWRPCECSGMGVEAKGN